MPATACVPGCSLESCHWPVPFMCPQLALIVVHPPNQPWFPSQAPSAVHLPTPSSSGQMSAVMWSLLLSPGLPTVLVPAASPCHHTGIYRQSLQLCRVLALVTNVVCPHPTQLDFEKLLKTLTNSTDIADAQAFSANTHIVVHIMSPIAQANVTPCPPSYHSYHILCPWHTAPPDTGPQNAKLCTQPEEGSLSLLNSVTKSQRGNCFFCRHLCKATRAHKRIREIKHQQRNTINYK